jgi:hypothetical protein
MPKLSACPLSCGNRSGSSVNREILGNSVRHSRSGDPGEMITVAVKVTGSAVRVEVTDLRGPGVPELVPAGGDEEGGRGLQLVAGLGRCRESVMLSVPRGLSVGSLLEKPPLWAGKLSVSSMTFTSTPSGAARHRDPSRSAGQAAAYPREGRDWQHRHGTSGSVILTGIRRGSCNPACAAARRSELARTRRRSRRRSCAGGCGASRC